MNASTPRGKAVRSRASQRLRNLTIGTTLAGMAASAGFGWLASATYDGTGASAANPTSSSTTTSDAIANAIVRATDGRWQLGTAPAGGARFSVSWPRSL